MTKKENVYYDFKDVRERDMDFLIMEEFGASQDFANIFLSKVNKINAKVDYIYHSKYQKYKGESDMIIICIHNDHKHALLIEDKIDAEAMPYQCSRYFKRADEAVTKGEFESYDIFITAPQAYLDSNSEAQLYPNKVSYEEIAEYMRLKSEEKYNFKLQMIEMALGRERKGYQPEENKEVASFWEYYSTELHRKLPFVNCTNERKKKCDNSHWPNFKSPCIGARIVHKAKQGYVDLQFNGMADRLNELGVLLNSIDVDKTGVSVVSAGKSGSIRIKCSPIDFEGKYSQQAALVEESLHAIERIYRIAEAISQKQNVIL